MAKSVLVDASFLVALLSRHDDHHGWASGQAEEWPPPWQTCESVLSEAFHLLGPAGTPALTALIRRGALGVAFDFPSHSGPVLRFLSKYADIPASLADAELVRMTEISADALLLTTDSDFRVYRRHGRQTVPVVTPGAT